MVVQALLPGTPEFLSTEANQLKQLIDTSTLPFQPDINIFSEKCPACSVEIPLTDINSAKCTNGHVWGTSFDAMLYQACVDNLSSPLLYHNFYSVHCLRPYMRWMPPESFLATVSAIGRGHEQFAFSSTRISN
jgi:hypothetical protein